MKRFVNIWIAVLVTVGAMLSLASCRKPRIIPDSTLAEIFYDSFLTNAYLSEKSVRTDSLALYEPIFEKYGYTVEDMQYTIGNFSKRKSARLGNVVEVAIARLESEGVYYDREVSILDTIEARARRIFTRTVYSDTLVKVHRLSDTARLHVVIDSLLRGEYEVSFTYNIDSLDKNMRQRVTIRSESQDGMRRVELNNVMQRRSDKQITQTVRNDGQMRRLEINLAELDTKVKAERPHMTFRDVTVRYVPFADDVVDSLYYRTLNLGIFNMKLMESHHEADSIAQASAAR